jgi:HEAT repeat protein
MQRSGRLLAALVAVAIVAGLAGAQTPFNQDARQQLQRNRDQPQGHQKFEEALRKFRSDNLPDRLEGIAAMGTMQKEPRAIEYLLEASNDDNPTIRVKAIDTLGAMQARQATAPLLQRIFMRDCDVPTKQRILAALGRIGDSRATPPLLDLLERNVPSDLKASALYALGEIGDEAARPAIESYAHRDASDPLSAVGKAALAKLNARPTPVEVPPVLAGSPRNRGPAAAD